MFMLTAYLDETGDSKDRAQRIVGMGGLLAPTDMWDQFELRWNRALKEFQIPYFHMREFAHSTGVFEDWKGKETKRRKLFGKLIKAMEMAYPIPIGATVPKDVYDSTFSQYPDFEKEDPYHRTLHYCVNGLAALRITMGCVDDSETVALVLSQHEQFKSYVLRHYDRLTKELPHLQKISSISFADMRQIVPLQAADVVAYELKKEHERRLCEPQKPSRYGYQRLIKMTSRHTALKIPMFYFLDETLLGFPLKVALDAKRAAPQD
jgi:hypothetical protein